MSDAHLARGLSGKFVLAVTVGGIIGLGILRGPGEIADVISDPTGYLALWLIGGLFVLLSTAVSAELVGMTPRSGGFYSLVRRAYGPYPGFVIGWADWLTYPADLALKAVVITEFTAILLPGAEAWATWLAIAVTSVFAVIQLRSINASVFLQETATALIGLIIVALAIVLFFVSAPDSATTPAAPAESSLRDWSLVLATIIFTYDGWLYAAYFSGEIRGGAGAVARGCIKGVVIVIALYVMLNLALVKSVGLAPLAGSDLALAQALELAVHPTAGAFVVVAAIIILLSHQNLEYLTASRILQALAADGLMVKKAESIGKGGNPVVALLITWVVAVSLIFVGGFEFLLLLSVFFYVPLYLALIAGILILRKTEPDTERPYRAWGHPWSTFLCLFGWSIITVFQAWVERETALYAVAMIAVSLPVYLFLARR
jgi:APA family basic amino acid/polyamine antiporter